MVQTLMYKSCQSVHPLHDAFEDGTGVSQASAARPRSFPDRLPKGPSLRPRIPRGWVATSFAEVDINKDGNLDQAR
jgi:hypothetical protein